MYYVKTKKCVLIEAVAILMCIFWRGLGREGVTLKRHSSQRMHKRATSSLITTSGPRGIQKHCVSTVSTRHKQRYDNAAEADETMFYFIIYFYAYTYRLQVVFTVLKIA